MGFVDDIGMLLGLSPGPLIAPGTGGTATVARGDEDFWGFRPGFDLGDIPDVLGRIFGGREVEPIVNGVPNGGVPNGNGPLGRLPTQGGMGFPTFPGGNPLDPMQFDPSAIARFFGGGGGGNGGNGRTNVGTTSLYIGGSCPGLWHTTPVRVVYNPKTGEPRQVGGNRRSNTVSMVQDDSGALQFVAEVKPTWSLKKKVNPARRHHHHRRKAVRHHHHRRRVTSGHRHSLTRKQLAAGFGGKAHMRAH